MTRLSNSFNGGTDGNLVTTANSGGTSGDAFDDITFGGLGPAILYNAAHAVFREMAVGINPITSGVAYLGYTSLGTLTTVWGRLYVEFPALPAANQQLVMVRDSVTAAQCAGISVLTDGRIRLVDAAGTTLTNSTTVLTAGSVARIEWRVVGHVSTGVVEAKILLSPHSTTPTETVTVTSANTRGSFDRFRVGQTATAASDLGVFYLDEIAWDDTAYPGPQVLTVSPGLLDASGVLLTPMVARNIKPALLDGTPVLFTPNVRRGVNVGLLDASASLFTPKLNIQITAGGAFQLNAFQNNTFQVDTGLFVDQSGVVFTPSVGMSITMPAPTGAFQTNAFQNNAFNTGGGLDGSPTVFAPSSVTVGDARVFPGFIDASGAALTPAIGANNIQPALLDGTPTVFTPTQVSMQIRMEDVGVWDSPDIVWDDPVVHWDGGGLGGIINQSGVLFTPTALKFSLTIGLLDQTPVLFAPSVAPKAIFVGLINGVGFLFEPTLPHRIVMPLLDASPEVFEWSFTGQISPDLLDASGVLFTPNVNPKEIDVPFLDGSGFVIAPEVKSNVTVPLLDATPTLFTPTVGSIVIPLLDASGVLFTPSLTPVQPPLLDGSGVALEPAKVNLPFVQTVRLDDFVSGLVDGAGVLFAPSSIELAPPKTIIAQFLDGSPLLLGPRIVVPTRPIIVLRARYDPVTVLKARYDPVTVKHAQNSRQGA